MAGLDQPDLHCSAQGESRSERCRSVLSGVVRDTQKRPWANEREKGRASGDVERNLVQRGDGDFALLKDLGQFADGDDVRVGGYSWRE